MLRIANFFTAMYCVSSERTNFALNSNSDSTCGIHLYAKKWIHRPILLFCSVSHTSLLPSRALSEIKLINTLYCAVNFKSLLPDVRHRPVPRGFVPLTINNVIQITPRSQMEIDRYKHEQRITQRSIKEKA